jgi:hypothetical protein
LVMEYGLKTFGPEAADQLGQGKGKWLNRDSIYLLDDRRLEVSKDPRIEKEIKDTLAKEGVPKSALDNLYIRVVEIKDREHKVTGSVVVVGQVADSGTSGRQPGIRIYPRK